MPPQAVRAQVAVVLWRAYAAHSYLYYQRNTSIITDGDFDELCKYILENYDWIKPHDLNNYLDETALGAGTGFHLVVVGQTRDYAEALLAKHNEATKKKKPAKKKQPEIDLDDLIGSPTKKKEIDLDDLI